MERLIADFIDWLKGLFAPAPSVPAIGILTPEQIARNIVTVEGGYVNDPADPGGPTNRGVTLKTLQGLRPGATLADLKALSSEDAATIYVENYFFKPKLHLLPQALHDTVFDMQVNAGNNAVKILQRLLNTANASGLTVDGSIGPKTIAAAVDAQSRMGPLTLRNAYGIARRNYYFDLADARPASRKYCVTKAGGKGGWILRAETFISPEYRLTTAEFRARIARWS